MKDALPRPPAEAVAGPGHSIMGEIVDDAAARLERAADASGRAERELHEFLARGQRAQRAIDATIKRLREGG
jgi:hypothetical protein